jgi:hypothetical protein
LAPRPFTQQESRLPTPNSALLLRARLRRHRYRGRLQRCRRCLFAVNAAVFTYEASPSCAERAAVTAAHAALKGDATGGWGYLAADECEWQRLRLAAYVLGEVEFPEPAAEEPARAPMHLPLESLAEVLDGEDEDFYGVDGIWNL